MTSASTPAARPAPSSTLTLPQQPAAVNGEYWHLFAEYLGKPEAETRAAIDAAWQRFFHEDIGKGDVRLEGMSCGMMIAVQLDHKEEFDRLNSVWARTKNQFSQIKGDFHG